jgi:hypothetical protein
MVPSPSLSDEQREREEGKEEDGEKLRMTKRRKMLHEEGEDNTKIMME